MRTVVAFSLYGINPLYQVGAVRNAVMYAEHRPDWELVFYVGQSIPEKVCAQILEANPRARCEQVAEKENASATWWRMRALAERPYAFMSRDTDSIPCARQRAAEDEWLGQTGDKKDQLEAHVMRDMEYHGAVMLAGLWGVKGDALLAIANKVRPSIEDFWTTDQIELQMRIYPMIRRNVMVHLGSPSCVYERMSQRRPFRVPRDPGSFVGQGLNADGSPRYPEHVTPELIISDAELFSNQNMFEARFR